eukprot:53996-Pelagomonas_calceolata.AAC.1
MQTKTSFYVHFVNADLPSAALKAPLIKLEGGRESVEVLAMPIYEFLDASALLQAESASNQHNSKVLRHVQHCRNETRAEELSQAAARPHKNKGNSTTARPPTDTAMCTAVTFCTALCTVCASRTSLQAITHACLQSAAAAHSYQHGPQDLN